MPRYLRPDKVREIQRIALAKGGHVRPFADGSHSRTVFWDISSKCQTPRTVELHGRASDEYKFVTVTTTNRPNFVHMEVRCRKCAACLRYRSYQWTQRALSQHRRAQRTWLGTFTLRPEVYVHLLSKARFTAHKAGVVYETLTGDEQFRRLDALIYDELQKWLKRLRKSTRKRISYLCVTEAHKSGVPHHHLLIHEMDGPIRHRELKNTWPLGFDHFRLVETGPEAAYVCKYLSKDVRARVRASQRYGA